MSQVSVVIPTYNYGKYIGKAIESVLSQTHKDFEILVVDDGSTDITRDKIEGKYKNEVRYFYQENKGAPEARNFGLRKAKGEFIVFLDADDWLMPTALQSRIEHLKKHPDSGWVYGPSCYHDEQGRDVTERFASYPFAYRSARRGNILPFMLLGELIHTPTVMVNRGLIIETGGFDVTLPCLQDYELWLRLAARSSVEFIDACNVVVVTHKNSISQSGTDGYRTRLKIMREAESSYPDAVRALGYKWRRKFAQVIAERGRHVVVEGDLSVGKWLLLEAIKKDPFYPRHYLGYIKTLLYFHR